MDFEVQSLQSSTPERYARDVYLFRPALEITSVPPELRVKYDPDKHSWSTSGRIRVRNAGAGTALIRVELASEDEFKLSTAASVDEFRKQFLVDLEIKLNTLKGSYPQYSDAVGGLLSLMTDPPFLDVKGRGEIGSAFEQLVNVLEDDEEFAKSLASAFVTAYLKNVQIITELTSFMEYLNSIGEGRVIMLNSLDVVKPSKERSRLRLVVKITDLAYSDYPQIEIPPINVTWEGEAPLPVHMLFDWRTKPKGAHKVG